ncbi:MAG TPA: hypothetical protein VLK25_03320 [Allosphingosinicella sp.]|nr:hypothetical protein [Allosphingosinicella sp.]
MSEDAAYFRERAAHCRRLARGISDQRTIAQLNEMAGEYEARAAELEPKPPLPPAAAG